MSMTEFQERHMGGIRVFDPVREVNYVFQAAV